MKKTMSNAEKPSAEKRTGRRPWIPPDLREVEALAQRGLAGHQIALVLGIHEATLSRKPKALRDFNNAIETGRALGIAAIAGSLVNAALAGNIDACIFYLRCVAGWSERHLEVITEEAERLEEMMRAREETMQLIRALTQAESDQYLKILEAAKARVRDGIVVKAEPRSLPPQVAALKVKDEDE